MNRNKFIVRNHRVRPMLHKRFTLQDKIKEAQPIGLTIFIIWVMVVAGSDQITSPSPSTFLPRFRRRPKSDFIEIDRIRPETRASYAPRRRHHEGEQR